MKVEDIWLEYRAALKRFLQAKVANEADVEDLLQDILIKTYNNLNSVKKQKSVKSWLFQIANNTIIDYYRKTARIQDVTNEALLSINAGAIHDQGTDKFSPHEIATPEIDLTGCIAPFINALPEESARLLTAIDINNESQKQYAETLGVSYSTLKSRVQKSRGLLKQVFDDCCHFKIDTRGNVYDYDKKTKS
jgi:RNA polymerase sigma-70 factor (ECF subfamily)